MNKVELLNLIENDAREYINQGVASSIIRNSHMNNWNGNHSEVDDDLVDAILVDFINFVGMRQGVDYGMYTRDLRKVDSE